MQNIRVCVMLFTCILYGVRVRERPKCYIEREREREMRTHALQ